MSIGNQTNFSEHSELNSQSVFCEMDEISVTLVGRSSEHGATKFVDAAQLRVVVVKDNVALLRVVSEHEMERPGAVDGDRKARDH